MTGDPEKEIIHRELETETESPVAEVVETVAEIEGKQPNELPSAYNCIDDMLEEMYSTPPSSEAQVEVTFTYTNYRITVEQNGNATLVKIN